MNLSEKNIAKYFNEKKIFECEKNVENRVVALVVYESRNK